MDTTDLMNSATTLIQSEYLIMVTVNSQHFSQIASMFKNLISDADKIAQLLTFGVKFENLNMAQLILQQSCIISQTLLTYQC